MNFVLGDMSHLFGNGLSVLVLLQEFIGRSFMFTDIANLLLLVVSISSIGALVAFKPKRLEHLLFSILAFSLVLVSVSALLPESFVIEQQFVVLGAFATCNVFWLLSRTLFRKGKALSTHHYILAGIIALLILFSRSIDIFVSFHWFEQESVTWLKRSLTEMVGLLSSGVILLAFWEAIRNYSSSSKSLRKQKMLFAGSMLVATFSTRVIAPSIPATPEVSEITYLWIRAFAASLVLISTFIVLMIQYKDRDALGLNITAKTIGKDEDDELLSAIRSVMEERKLYLNAELKMMDIANALQVPEYKISRALRDKSSFDNFNQFVNYMRIEHAKQLLIEDESQSWTILVISMESGFASLATFNRAFKVQEGCTPNHYRKKMAMLDDGTGKKADNPEAVDF